MIFYDTRQKRKFYVRIIVVVITLGTTLVLANLLLIVTSIINASPKTLSYSEAAKTYNYYYTPINNKKISLTFDDGPDAKATPKILELLEKHNIQATFFVMGRHALSHPFVLKDIAKAGHEIGNHTFTHSRSVHDSPKRLAAELRSTDRIIEAIIGHKTFFYRPPYLLDVGIDPTVNPDLPPEAPLAWGLREGFLPVGADIDTNDWRVKSVEAFIESFNRDLARGHIVLLHDGTGSTNIMLEGLDYMIRDLKSRGYEFVTLRELLFPIEEIKLEKNLSVGSMDTNEVQDVSLLQYFLSNEGFLDASYISGTFDANTSEALKLWQLRNGVVFPDDLANAEYGMTGELTRLKIREASKRYTSGELETHYISQRISTKSVWPEAVYTLSAAFILTCLYIFYFAVLILVSLRIVCMFLLLGFSKIKDARRISTHRYNDGVSVLIPAYNEEENIESTIKSVVFNDYQKKEIIVVDDGSTDSTARIVAHLAVVYSGIKLIRTPNNGKATAIRIGMEVSTFDVCVIMDADTIFKKNTISKLVARFWDRKVGAVAGKIATARSRSFIDVLQRIEYIVGQNIDKMAFGGVNAINVVPGPVGAWRKSAVRSVGGPSQDTLVEDQDLTLALLEAGYRVEYEPRAIAFTETPHTFRDFLKQRFRWIYGSIQCVWKYKRSLIRKPFSSLSLIIIPNTLIFGFLIPLFSPLIDITLVASVMLGQSEHVIMPYIVFTALDFIYALFAFIPEKKDRLKVFLIPIQRLYYRQVMYYVVLVGIIRALEGTGALWGKVRKIGESQKLYLTDEHQLDNV